MADEELSLNLRILSPSTEVEGGVVFPDISGATTVHDLRVRIREAFSSKPSPERMRLIYRGRVVANEDATLVNVFGADNIRESKDQSLHLVLRELTPAANGSSLPASQSSPALPTQNETLPRLPPNPFRAIPQPQRPSSQPQLPPHHHHHPAHPPHAHHHHHQHAPGQPGPWPIPNFGQQLRQTMAQNLPPFGNIPPQNGQPPQNSVDGTESPNNAPAPPPSFGQTPLFGQGLRGPGMIPSGGRTVRQEGIGPNGERWSVTINETNVDLSGHPPHTSNPQNQVIGVSTQLARAGANLGNARREFQFVVALNEASFTAPLNSAENITRHLRNTTSYLDLVESDAATILASAEATLHGQATALRDAARLLRTQVDASSNGASGLRPVRAQTSSPSPPSGVPSELFVLSSPQGPVAVLYDQRGTFRTAPMVQTLPYQTYSNQFALNRQHIAGLGQQIALGPQMMNARLPHPQPTPTQPAAGGAQAAPNQPQDQAQPPAQNQDQRPAQAQVIAPPEEDRVGNIAGHLWLIFKLACFVYFFAGGGSGWYRPVVLCLMAGLVYLAQVGIFDHHFNIIRQHFEALLPVGALADRVAQPVNGQAQQQRHAGMAGLTPEEAARRLMADRQGGAGWLREGVRTIERSLAIFLASLWPGIGERMVHAQEERARLERVAEAEERQRIEDERKKAEEEALQREQSEKQDGVGADAQGEGSGDGGGKGKERAEESVQGGQA